MAKFKIAISGVETTQLKFKKLHGYKPVIRSCIKKSLAEMKNRSNILTPKDSGELRNSAFGKSLNDLEGVFGFTKEYAPHVEYGHRIVRGGRQVGFCPANPFLAPNASAQHSIFISDCKVAINILRR